MKLVRIKDGVQLNRKKDVLDKGLGCTMLQKSKYKVGDRVSVKEIIVEYNKLEQTYVVSFGGLCVVVPYDSLCE